MAKRLEALMARVERLETGDAPPTLYAWLDYGENPDEVRARVRQERGCGPDAVIVLYCWADWTPTAHAVH